MFYSRSGLHLKDTERMTELILVVAEKGIDHRFMSSSTLSIPTDNYQSKYGVGLYRSVILGVGYHIMHPIFILGYVKHYRVVKQFELEFEYKYVVYL